MTSSKDKYPYEVLETFYADVSLALNFLKRMQAIADTCEGPVTDMDDQLAVALAETEVLFDKVVRLSGRERIDERKAEHEEAD